MKPLEKTSSSPRQTHSSLAQRIILLMIVVSLLMISAFTLIQLMNQLSSITRENEMRSSLSALVLKNRMENIQRQFEDPARAAAEMKTALYSLAAEKMADNAWIMDQNQKIVATSDTSGEHVINLSEKYMIETLFQKDFFERWFYTFRDQQNNALDLYIPTVGDNGHLTYLIKASFPLGNIQSALNQVYIPVILMILAVIFINLFLGVLLSRNIIRPIRMLNEATKEIAGGKLDLRVTISTHDEIQELGETFNEMAMALERMKQKAESANPLTKLPGNVTIQEEIEKRIAESRKFVVIHSDLDNFKAYNDNYGISQGDIAIKLTAELLKEAVKEKGNANDFLGHEGGDDFVMITTPDKADILTDYFIKRFDESIPQLYRPDDQERGFIVAKNRQGVICEFPLISISLAGVTNQHIPYQNYAEITNRMIEVKEKVKNTKGSCFLLDRRLKPREN